MRHSSPKNSHSLLRSTLKALFRQKKVTNLSKFPKIIYICSNCNNAYTSIAATARRRKADKNCRKIVVTMTEKETTTLLQFEQKLRLLVFHHQKAQERIKELTHSLEQADGRIQELEQRLATIEHSYNNLKQAKVISLSDAEISTTRERLTSLVREIDRCIASLTK